VAPPSDSTPPDWRLLLILAAVAVLFAILFFQPPPPKNKKGGKRLTGQVEEWMNDGVTKPSYSASWNNFVAQCPVPPVGANYSQYGEDLAIKFSAYENFAPLGGGFVQDAAGLSTTAPRADPDFSYSTADTFNIGEVKTSTKLNILPQVGCPGRPGDALTGRQRQLYPLIQRPGSGALWYKPTDFFSKTLIAIDAPVPVDFFEIAITDQPSGGKPLGG
jgi:hypothetical protein